MRYRAQQILNIRREPRITGSNRIGQLAAGTERDVLDTMTNSNGETWGQITEADNHGIAGWVCIQNINTVFMKPVATMIIPIPSGDAWRIAIDAWARAQGFNGPQA